MVVKIFHTLLMLCSLVAASASQSRYTGQSSMSRPAMTYQQPGMGPLSDHQARQGRLIYNQESTRIKSMENYDGHGGLTIAKIPMKTGHVSYISPEGTRVKLDYLADENGYQTVSFFSNENVATTATTPMFNPVSGNSPLRFPNPINVVSDQDFRTPSYSYKGIVSQASYSNPPMNYQYGPSQSNSHLATNQGYVYVPSAPAPLTSVYYQVPNTKIMTGLREYYY